MVERCVLPPLRKARSDGSATIYESTLGLPAVDDSPFALVVEADGTHVRITRCPIWGHSC